MSIDVAENYAPDNNGKQRPTQWHRIVVWRDLAEHLGGTLTKGDRVIAYGTVRERSYEDRTGVDRTIKELHAQDIGLSVRWNTVDSNRDTAPKSDTTVTPDDFDGDPAEESMEPPF